MWHLRKEVTNSLPKCEGANINISLDLNCHAKIHYQYYLTYFLFLALRAHL